MSRPKKNVPLPGLIRVPADESKPLKYWQASVELAPVDGKRKRKTARSRDWDTAKRALDVMQANLAANPLMTSRSLTVAEWAIEYLDKIAVKRIRPKTLGTYQGLIEREVIPIIGDLKVDALAPADIRRVVDRIEAKGLSSTTAMQVHRIMSVMLKYGIREGHTHRNVAELVDAPRPAMVELDALTVDEAVKLIRHSRDTGDPLWTLWAAVLLTGARQGELLGLQTDRVGEFLDLSWQLQRLTWQHGCGGTCGRIRGSDCPKKDLPAPSGWAHRNLVGGFWLTAPKSRAGTRIVPLVEPLRSILAEHQEATASVPNPYGLVWRTPLGKPIDPRQESSAWHDALRSAGLPRIRLHDGRHTTVDLLYQAGVPEDVISEIVGHSTRATTRAYKSRASQVRKIAAMTQLSELVNLHDLDTPRELEA